MVNLPTNFETDWSPLLLECFAWFSHRQTLNVLYVQPLSVTSEFTFVTTFGVKRSLLTYIMGTNNIWCQKVTHSIYQGNGVFQLNH
jgi:hypothetical protein